MLYIYPACFYKETDGRYSVIFPDLNHLATQGDSFDKAFAMAIDCLAGYIFEAKMSKEELPPPSDISEVNPDAEYDGYDEVIVNLVAVDADEYAKTHFEIPVKKTLTIPKWLNDAATAKKINFSQTLQEALLQKI